MLWENNDETKRQKVRPRQESNLRLTRIRNPQLYPLSYGSKGGLCQHTTIPPAKSSLSMRSHAVAVNVFSLLGG